MLHLRVHPRQVLDRPHHEGQVGDEGVDAADRDQAQLALQAAVPDDGAQGQRGDDLHGRQEQRGEPGGAIGGPVHAPRQDLELAQVLRLAPEGLDDADALDAFVVGAGDL